MKAILFVFAALTSYSAAHAGEPSSLCQLQAEQLAPSGGGRIVAANLTRRVEGENETSITYYVYTVPESDQESLESQYEYMVTVKKSNCAKLGAIIRIP